MFKGIWRFVKKLLPYALMFEGIDHFIFSTVSVVGLSIKHEFGFFMWFNPIVDYILGTITLVSGLYFRHKNRREQVGTH